MKRHGHMLVGAVTGLGFGLSAALALAVFGIVSLGSPLVGILPPLFLLLGALWARSAPMGHRRATTDAAAG